MKNSEQARLNMVEQQIRPWNVLDQRVLGLLSIVKREHFVPAAYRHLAFMDLEIPLLQTKDEQIQQYMFPPKLEARVLQELAPQRHETICEIGTGSGYLAALLAHCGEHVITFEIKPELAEFAQQNLHHTNIHNVRVVTADIFAQDQFPPHTYDIICVSGSMPFLPPFILAAVKPGGRLAVFIGTAPILTFKLITRINATEQHSTDILETYVGPLLNAPEPAQFKF